MPSPIEQTRSLLAQADALLESADQDYARVQLDLVKERAGRQADAVQSQATITALTAEVTALKAQLEPPADPGYDPKTEVLFDDLYDAGMGDRSLALQKVVNKVTGGKVLVLPNAEFTIGTGGWQGKDDGKGDFAPALLIHKQCGGLRGTGTMNFDDPWSSDCTHITLAPNTCRRGSVGGAAVHAGKSGSAPLTFKNFWLTGTDQGKQTSSGEGPGSDGKSEKLVTGLYVYNAPSVVAEDLFTNGFHGNNGAPPGETFQNQYVGCGKVTLRRLRTDARREKGGKAYGAVGITVANCAGYVWEDCVSVGSNGSANMVLFQTGPGVTRRLVCGQAEVIPSVGGVLKSGFNHERTTGTVHEDLTVYAITGRPHIFHTNDTWSSGPSGSVVDGSLTIRGVKWNDAGVASGKLVVETWKTTMGGAYTNRTAPTVKDKSGADVPFRWSTPAGGRDVTSGQRLT